MACGWRDESSVHTLSHGRPEVQTGLANLQVISVLAWAWRNIGRRAKIWFRFCSGSRWTIIGVAVQRRWHFCRFLWRRLTEICFLFLYFLLFALREFFLLPPPLFISSPLRFRHVFFLIFFFSSLLFFNLPFSSLSLSLQSNRCYQYYHFMH